jgi:hypothetical protein
MYAKAAARDGVLGKLIFWEFCTLVEDVAVGLALFTMFSPALGLWVGTFHRVICVRQNTVQSMTAKTMVHVTNLTPPGSECHPTRRRRWRPTNPCRRFSTRWLR